MNPRILVLGRTVLLLAAVLTLALFFVRPSLPVTQAEKPPVDNAAPAQGFVSTVASVHCDAGNMVIEVTAGNAPFTVSGTGPSLPPQLPALGSYTILGDGTSLWQEVMVTSGNSVMLGDVDCTGAYIPFVVNYYCTSQQFLFYDLVGGDGPFTLRVNGSVITGLPAYSDSRQAGSPFFYGVTFEEENGDHEVIYAGDIDCTVPSPLSVWVSCYYEYLHLEIRSGNPPFIVTGTGPELPLTFNHTDSNWYSHTSGTWQNLTVTEINTDHESLSLGNITCPDPATLRPLTANAACHGFDLSVWIGSGDESFIITGTGPGLPIYWSTGSLNLQGPGVWTGVTVTENSGDHESLLLGDFDCSTWPYPPNLTAFTGCVGNALSISIGGDPPYLVEGNGPSLPLTLEYIGVAIIGDVGPSTWTGITITELGGDREQINVPDISCPVATPPPPTPPPTNLVVNPICTANDVFIYVMGGDGPFVLEGSAPGLPVEMNLYNPYILFGPATWSDLVVRELGGDGERYAIPSISCSLPPSNLQATMTCDNGDLVVEILSGDPFFAIIGTGPGLPTSTMYTGVYRFPGPAVWTDLNVHEPVGNPVEQIDFGTMDCTGTTPPPQTPEPPSPPPAPIVLPEYVPEVVMQLSVTTPQIVYDAPNGEPIHHPDGSLLMLPQDSDGSGTDTYLILDAAMVDDVAWVGVYLGGPNLGWLPLESLTVPAE